MPRPILRPTDFLRPLLLNSSRRVLPPHPSSESSRQQLCTPVSGVDLVDPALSSCLPPPRLLCTATTAARLASGASAPQNTWLPAPSGPPPALSRPNATSSRCSSKGPCPRTH